MCWYFGIRSISDMSGRELSGVGERLKMEDGKGVEATLQDAKFHLSKSSEI